MADIFCLIFFIGLVAGVFFIFGGAEDIGMPLLAISGLALIVTVVFAELDRHERFMAECLKDSKQEYECVAMWRRGA